MLAQPAQGLQDAVDKLVAGRRPLTFSGKEQVTEIVQGGILEGFEERAIRDQFVKGGASAL